MMRSAYTGTVTSWDADNGHGEIEVINLGRVWGHFSAIEAQPDTFRELKVGSRVLVEVSRRDEDDDDESDAPGYKWVAERITQNTRNAGDAK